MSSHVRQSSTRNICNRLCCWELALGPEASLGAARWHEPNAGKREGTSEHAGGTHPVIKKEWRPRCFSQRQSIQGCCKNQ